MKNLAKDLILNYSLTEKSKTPDIDVVKGIYCKN